MDLVEGIDQSPSPSSSNSDDFFGDPEVFPRLGDEYQVAIPSLISKPEPLHLQNVAIDNVNIIDFNAYTREEFAIPVMWLHSVDADKFLDSKYSTVHRDSLDISDSSHALPQAYVPLPELLVSSWSDAELESFLLGLYIFGKNLVQVQKFVESKEMSDILSFYYGKFFRSDAHRRWVECRKMRSRKWFFGHRIFTGSRQQEILSRLLPSRSEEVQDTLLEAFKAFNEGSASLEDFSFTLKSIVGMESFVQAIGIGKGKQDLTGIVPDPVRPNPVGSARPEIPVGKACSLLTLEEIINFLTGDFRISKAKSSDLFWEAIWPRLLARGWHSEQPKHVRSFTSKHGLVFLIPGIKKFSRKKLKKGTHYYDSLTDVMNKVTSDPQLLELDADEAKENEETAVDNLAVQYGQSKHQRPCYLRPRLPDSNSVLKFTVVDTSLVPGVVRELRCLPADANRRYRRPFNCGRETKSEDTSNEKTKSLNSLEESDQGPCDDKKPITTSSDRFVTDCCPIYGDELDKQTLKDMKYESSCKVKSERKNPIAPVYKRRRLSACNRSSIQRDYEELKKENKHFQTASSSSSSSSSSKENVADQVAVSSPENPQQGSLIDLNLQPQNFDTEGPSAIEGDLKPIKDSSGTKQHLDHDSSFQARGVDGQQASLMNRRRQSTRNRPPTAKALEALACGFLGVKKERSMKPSRASRRRSHKNDAVEASDSLPGASVGMVDDTTFF